MKIIFMGTPEFAVPVLDALYQKHDIVCVYTQPPRPSGRGMELMPTPIEQEARNKDLQVRCPENFKNEADLKAFEDLKADVSVVCAYGLLLPKRILDACPKGCINIHPSLLPRWRGAAPIQRAIMNGDKTTGITLMEMVEKMDAGRMYDKEEVIIEDNDNYSSICDKLSLASIKVATRSILDYANGELPGVEQDESEATFANKIKPEDEHLPIKELNCKQFNDYVRGLSLTPGAYSIIDNLKFKIFASHTFSKEIKGEVGQIVLMKKGVYVQLKDGIVLLDKVQLEGKKEMDGLSFSNGSHYLEGKVLS